ncbi:MAG: hypothetical protein KJ955_00330 [Nanoarchaeota archaeon]|nr:hypothetical protein [Nanoarchaeota archaeon]
MSLIEILKTPEMLEAAKNVHARLEEEHETIRRIQPLWLPAVEERLLGERLACVAGKINDLLDIHPQLPGIEYNRSYRETTYDKNRRCILLCYQDIPLLEVDAAIAHEYCHYLQHHVSGRAEQWAFHAELKEGFARGIELIIARQTAKEKGNNHFSKKAIEIAASDMEIFLKQYNNRQAMPAGQKAYSLGVTAMLVAESMHGNMIYRRLIKSTRPYRLLEGFLLGAVTP